MRTSLFRSLTLFICLLSLCSVAITAYADGYDIQLDVPLLPQQTSSTCADASARECIAYYYQHGFITGKSSSIPSEAQLVSEYGSGSITPIVNGLRDYCGVSFGYRAKTTPEDFYTYVSNSLRRGNPVVAEVYLNADTSWVLGYTTTNGHYLVISGIKKIGNEEYLVITDPWNINGAGIGQVIEVPWVHICNVCVYYVCEQNGLEIQNGSLPIAALDVCNGYPGSIRVAGWAFDRDNVNGTVPVHVYVGGPAGSGSGYEIYADKGREDVDAVYSVGIYHGFDSVIEVPLRGTQNVYLYACDIGDVWLDNPQFATATVTISDPYTIEYDSNGGRGAPTSQKKAYGIDLTLSSVEPVRDGYRFEGWTATPNAIVADYAPGDAFDLNAETTLYAVWKKQYSITYDANGGINPPASQKKNEGEDLRLSEIKPNYPGHTFLGWALTPGAVEAAYQPGDSFVIDADTMLYAVWARLWVVEFDGDPLIIATDGETFNLSSEALGIQEKQGYQFLGWSTDPTAATAEYQPGDFITVHQDMQLFSIWQKVYSSEWSETRPSGISEDLIETKTQYRYSTRETTTDTVSSKPGWTLTGSQQVWGNYGDWSSWSLDAVSKSDSREVETTAMYRYYYFYCPVCGRHEPFQGMSDCGQYSLSSGDSYIGWFTTPYDQSNYQGFSYTNAKYYTTSLGDGQTWCFSAGNLSSSAIGTKDSDSDAVVITTGYRYRTRSQSTVYNFERWTDWSEWSDTPIEASDTKRMETRTLYRCKIDEDRILTLPGALTKIESEAFRNIAADAVVIPESVRSIADDAFDAGIVIIGKTNSYAQLYAGWNNLMFIPSDDLNG